ncbi:MAG TPA: SPOR domain-containing protein, partial [Pirellulales bacterium]
DAYSIKCGAYAEARNADLQRSTLAKKGLNPFIRREAHNGRRLSVVLVGQYPTYDQALSHLAMVRKVVYDAVLWP